LLDEPYDFLEEAWEISDELIHQRG
jgi:hypothetical protein